MNTTTFKKSIQIVAIGALALLTAAAQATVVQTAGAGSAVSTVNGVANFESQDAVSGNPYSEGGLSFSRTGLSSNNCGYAGCASHIGFAGFTGNYMYGVGSGGYFTLAAEAGTRLYGLEMLFGTGFSNSSVHTTWQAFDSDTLVGSGDFSADTGAVIGFASAGGFTSLRFTSTSGGLADFTGSFNAPAFDTVRAQFTAAGGNQVPEPASLALVGAALLGAAAARRSRQAA